MLAPANRPSSFIYRSLSALWRGAALAPSPFGRGLGRGLTAARNENESRSLSLEERAGVRERSLSLRRDKRKNLFSSALSPLPNPLPEGEGVTTHRSLLTAHCSGRARLSTLLVLCTLLLALSTFALVRTRAASVSEPPVVAGGPSSNLLPTAHSL